MQNTANPSADQPAIDVTQVDVDRSTEFRAVESGESHSGEVLLVQAYAVLWVILFGFLWIMFRKQSAIDTRLAALDRVLDKAAAKPSAAAGGGD